MKSRKRIYLDTAAATPVDKRVKTVMLPYFDRAFGNPSSIHAEGVAAAKAIQVARAKVAELLFAHPDEIIFTSGGTESNNLALAQAQDGAMVTSAIEHASVLNASPNAVRVPVDARGVIDLKKFKESLTPETKLVSVMYANNEIGTIQPIREIAKIIRAHRKKYQTNLPYLHTDACQATRFLDLNVARLGVDMLTLNAAKIYGPKGTGVLYVRRGVGFSPMHFGGGQEADRRAGTEDVAGIIGLACAMELAAATQTQEAKKLSKLRDYFIKEISKIPGTKVNGIGYEQLPHLVNVLLPEISAEQMVLELDARGVSISAGSACSYAAHNESYVIMALGRTKKEAEHSVRLSFDRSTSKEELHYVLRAINDIIEKYALTKIYVRDSFT